jgi:serine/threonine protein kinase
VKYRVAAMDRFGLLVQFRRAFLKRLEINISSLRNAFLSVRKSNRLYLILDDDPEMNQALMQELIILWRLRDEPNIARFIGYTDNPAIIMMCFYSHGCLSKLIHKIKKGPLPIDMTETIALGIARAIEAVHNLGFAHCDIKV